MYRSDLFNFYHEIEYRRVEVSANKGVRETGQHIAFLINMKSDSQTIKTLAFTCLP